MGLFQSILGGGKRGLVIVVAVTAILAYVLFIRFLPGSAGAWEVDRGAKHVRQFDFEVVPWTTVPRVWSNSQNEDVFYLHRQLADVSFRWQPKGRETAEYAWRVNIASGVATPIGMSEFDDVDKHEYTQVLIPGDRATLPQLGVSGTVDKHFSVSVAETERSRLYATLSISSLDELRWPKYFTGVEGFPFMGGGYKGWRMLTYLSGTAHLELFSGGNSNVPIVSFRREISRQTTLTTAFDAGTWFLDPTGQNMVFVVHDRLSSAKRIWLVKVDAANLL